MLLPTLWPSLKSWRESPSLRITTRFCPTVPSSSVNPRPALRRHLHETKERRRHVHGVNTLRRAVDLDAGITCGEERVIREDVHVLAAVKVVPALWHLTRSAPAFG